MCMDGKVVLIWVDSERFIDHKRNFFDVEWNPIIEENKFPINPKGIEKPSCLSELISVAEELSKLFAHVRCDFYIIDDQIKFGELTFTSGTGLADFTVGSYFDRYLGEKLNLPAKKPFKKLTYKQIRKSEKEFLKSL